MLTDESSHAQVAALQILGRLNSVSINDAEKLATKTDPRIRASVAISLKQNNTIEGVEILTRLLADNELPVAAQAAISLSGKHDFSKTIVPELCKAISREKIAPIVASSLASFGTNARSSVPFILERADSIGYRVFQDMAEDALSHIGPPDPSDIPKLCELLAKGDTNSTTLVARSIGLLGRNGKPASEALELAIDRLILRAQQAKIEEQDPDWEEDYDRDNSAQYAATADECAAAYWHITGNAEMFIELIERISSKTDEPSYFQDVLPWEIYKLPSPWMTFPNSDVALIENLLQSESTAVVASGLYAVCKLGSKANVLAESVRQVNERDLDLPSSILVPALDAVSSSRPIQTREIVDEATAVILKSQSSAREKIKLLSKLETQSDRAIEFYISCLSSSEVWDRHDAIVQLGLNARQSEAAIEPILSLVEKETHMESRFQAEKTLYLIGNDANRFDDFLVDSFKNEEEQARTRIRAVKVIGELESEGAGFLHHLKEHKTWFIENNVQDLCETLGKVGGTEARNFLQTLKQSKDWKIKRFAGRALANINSTETEGDSDE